MNNFRDFFMQSKRYYIPLTKVFLCLAFCFCIYSTIKTIGNMVDAQSDYWTAKIFLEKKPNFTAVIALNDLLATGAMNALKGSGLSIPEDVAAFCERYWNSDNVFNYSARSTTGIY